MKARKILIVLVVIIAALLGLSLIFPEEGIHICGIDIRFPSLHSIVASREPKEEETEEEPLPAPDFLQDSILYYRHLVDSSDIRFWLPDEHYLDAFWQAAENARAEGRTLRILHYGDSQIEMDHISSRLRAYMQKEFGGGGPGMLHFQSVTPSLTVRQSNTGKLTHLASFGDKSAVRSKGDYGLMMQSYRLAGGSATVTVKNANSVRVDDAAKRMSRVKLIANNKSHLDVEFSNLDRKGETSQQKAPAGVSALYWRTDSLTSAIKVKVSGTADIYGLIIDDAEGGVAVDNIPMRGCSGTQFTLVDEKLLSDAYSTIDVGLIIMQFGGNSVPYLKPASIANYCRSIGRQIDYVHRCCPDAKIIFIGPSDMSKKLKGVLQTYAVIPQLIDSLAATANAHGAAYWSIYHAMGGHNSMIQWSRQGLAGKDYIHFSQKGADTMGNLLSEAFDNCYTLYNLEQRQDAQNQKIEAQKQKKADKKKSRKEKKKRKGGRK